MPGICVRAAAEANAEIQQDLAAMLDSLRHYSWYTVEPWSDPSARVALGRVSLGFVDTAPQPYQGGEGPCTVVLGGELYDVERLRQELASAGQRPTTSSHAELLLRGYLRDGTQFLRRLNGAFVAAIWDARQERLTICNDRFGMKPLYYAHAAGKLLAASEIKALLLDGDVSRSEDMTGMAQFFSFGHLYGENTMLEGVRALPPASVLTYDAREDRLAVESYWNLPTGDALAGAGAQSNEQHLDAIEQAFAAAVDRCVEGTDHLGLALSGGLDARSILALVNHQRVPLRTVCLGVPGSLDHRCAAELAALTNRDHHQFSLDGTVCDSDTYRMNMQRTVHLTDGHYMDQGIVMPMLPFYRQLGIEVLLRGHAGELMHMHKAYNFSLDDTAWRIHDQASLEAWLMPRLSGWMLADVPEQLFRRATPAQVQELALATLRECLQESAEVQPAIHRIWHMFIRQRMPRETALSLAMIGSTVETRVPILDAKLVELLLAAPPELKVSDQIQTYILRRHRPEFLKVVNANNGAPMNAGHLHQQIATLRMKVLAKLGVKGYQPYERLGLWLRRELKPLVTETLLDDRCLDRGVFVPDTVRRLVQRHWEKRANHTFLILAMLIYEMGQRDFVDGERAPRLDEAAGR
ncbi:MAG: hypothetical protein K8T91_24165 [Planctomycetes bacterium]|nr:hypothetical protein [Planctomycetota bacterium]